MNTYSHSRRFESMANYLLNHQHERKDVRDRATGKLRTMGMANSNGHLLPEYATLVKKFQSDLIAINVQIHGAL